MAFKNKILYPLLDNVLNKSNNNAFCINNVFYTYRELGILVASIRSVLISSEIKEKNIGLVVNDDIESYASIFALWLEGKCYVPLHPNQPIDRCIDIMSQIDSQYILDSSSVSRFESYNLIKTKEIIKTDLDILSESPKGNDEDLAYILFTSGSTGKPKGVMLTRHNLASFVDSFENMGYEMSETDRCLQCFDLTFDLSVGSYIIPVIHGACVYTVPLNVIKYNKIYELLFKYKLTFATLVPSTINCLRPYFSEISIPSLKYCLFCGEALYKDLILKWKECIPNAQIDNVYGPTENTIYCTRYRCGVEIKENNGIICIGQDMKNSECHIVDEDDNFIFDNRHGELCLAGSQLTAGYINNPDKNLESFFVKDGIRYYRTGDICYLDQDGDIMYIGRKDAQVKIQGFRVELSEIEFHCKQYLKTCNAVVIAHENNSKFMQLYLFIENDEFPIEGLLSYLRTKLPSYEIPSDVYFVPVFPLNSNGKIDKVELKKHISNS